jgi:hypothetical protein
MHKITDGYDRILVLITLTLTSSSHKNDVDTNLEYCVHPTSPPDLLFVLLPLLPWLNEPAIFAFALADRRVLMIVRVHMRSRVVLIRGGRARRAWIAMTETTCQGRVPADLIAFRRKLVIGRRSICRRVLQ